MAATTFQVGVYHPLTRQQLAPPLRLIEYSWTEIVSGNGSFTGSLSMPADPVRREQLKTALETDESAVYVRSSNGGYAFGGVLTGKDWDPDQKVISITVPEWRSWLYGVFLEPKLDMTADRLYSWVQIDQLQIARELIAYACEGGAADGRPTIAVGAELSGRLRDLGVRGLEFKRIGELLDTMARRDGGFEWTISTVDGADFLPSLRLNLGYPELGGSASGMYLYITPDGQNCQIVPPVTHSSAERYSRVWATGNTEVLPFAQDTDPAVAGGATLMRQKTTSYSSVQDRSTLSSHARAERRFYGEKIHLIRLRVPEASFDVTSYPAGTRCRFQYKDEMHEMDLPYARIVERKVSPANGAGSVELTLDLSDYEVPEVDSGGAV